MPLAQDLPEAPEEAPSDERSYQPYDPAAVRAPTLDPSQSSDAPGVAESHGVSDVALEAVSFDERYKLPFKGLAFVGALSKTFTWLGHEFVIRTLTTDEILAVALITAKYEGTMAEVRAYNTAVAALATQSVDKNSLPSPYMEGTGIAWAEERFNYVKGQWFSYTIDKVYEEYLILEAKVREVLAAMGNP